MENKAEARQAEEEDGRLDAIFTGLLALTGRSAHSSATRSDSPPDRGSLLRSPRAPVSLAAAAVSSPLAAWRPQPRGRGLTADFKVFQISFAFPAKCVSRQCLGLKCQEPHPNPPWARNGTANVSTSASNKNAGRLSMWGFLPALDSFIVWPQPLTGHRHCKAGAASTAPGVASTATAPATAASRPASKSWRWSGTSAILQELDAAYARGEQVLRRAMWLEPEA